MTINNLLYYIPIILVILLLIRVQKFYYEKGVLQNDRTRRLQLMVNYKSFYSLWPLKEFLNTKSMLEVIFVFWYFYKLHYIEFLFYS